MEPSPVSRRLTEVCSGKVASVAAMRQVCLILLETVERSQCGLALNTNRPCKSLVPPTFLKKIKRQLSHLLMDQGAVD